MKFGARREERGAVQSLHPHTHAPKRQVSTGKKKKKKMGLACTTKFLPSCNDQLIVREKQQNKKTQGASSSHTVKFAHVRGLTRILAGGKFDQNSLLHGRVLNLTVMLRD